MKKSKQFRTIFKRISNNIVEGDSLWTMDRFGWRKHRGSERERQMAGVQHRAHQHLVLRGGTGLLQYHFFDDFLDIGHQPSGAGVPELLLQHKGCATFSEVQQPEAQLMDFLLGFDERSETVFLIVPFAQQAQGFSW